MANETKINKSPIVSNNNKGVYIRTKKYPSGELFLGRKFTRWFNKYLKQSISQAHQSGIEEERKRIRKK